MGIGVALSTPREHLNNIEAAVKGTGVFVATARIRHGPGAAAQAYPLDLGSLLTVSCDPFQAKFRRVIAV